ncbi:type II toxin-antitoxin system PemK/MazF family toxin [Sulfurimonas sp.]|jgi:mRNA interferase MazF|uniref:type II toxin-antitoxin system PemK/MazF family toxin n=1 Tax=Sulfurimonas sp. TaxID=2022749 RepID=UPI0025E5F2FC|nr:type II toxin-antitoxin system PemK/MazF family toxin [Sulfurimonas sp.]MBT5935544.1 type II toxin-antitoxin system PemK/MazF family toxin [Sulfurimonas sp.]
MHQYDKLNEVKKETLKNKRKLGIKSREIFWVKIGQNIGDEEYGKGDMFSRPIIVVKQLTGDLFLGIPLTSTLKNDDYFHSFEFSTKKGIVQNSAMILQLKAFSKKRITDKIGKIDTVEFKKIQDKLVKMIIPT